MELLLTRVNTTSEDFKRIAEHNRALASPAATAGACQAAAVSVIQAA